MHDHQSQRPEPAATIPAGFAAATADPARPLLTWYDDRTGERTELSGATCANWLAKTANLLVDGAGLAPGEVAVVAAPPHWQTAAIMLGCWSAGLQVTDRIPDEPAAVGFATLDRVPALRERVGELYGLALAPLAAPLPDPPPGVADFVVEVRAHGDHFTPPAPVSPDDPATPPPDQLSHRQLCTAAAARADQLGIGSGGRVLVDLAAFPDPLDWLLAPLLAGASTVLCQHLDPARLESRMSTERVTTLLRRS